MTTGALDPRNDMLVDMTQPVNLLHPLNRGLVSWSLELPGTMGGRRILDIMNPGPNGNHGTLVMDPVTAWVSGALGLWGALDFNGSSDHVVLGASKLVGPSKIFTFTAQIRTTVGGQFDRFFMGEASTANNTPIAGIGQNGGLSEFFYRDSVGITRIVGSVDISDGESHMVVGTADGENMFHFVDGKEDGASIAISTGTLTVDTFTIGALQRIAVGLHWAGALDEVRVYNRTLSPFEVAELNHLRREDYPGMLNRLPPISDGMIAAASLIPPIVGDLPEYGQRRAAIGDPPVYGATIVRS